MEENIIISVDKEKSFDKIQYPLIIKTQKPRNRKFLIMITGSCENSTDNMVVGGERLRFPLRSRTR